jgi:predicted PurR-regulated permease PerM
MTSPDPLVEFRYRALKSAAAVVIVVAGLRAAASVLNPLLMSAVVVACAVPLQNRLRQRGWGPRLAMTSTVLAVVTGLLLFGTLLGYAAKKLVATVPQYQDRLSQLLASGTGWLEGFGIDTSRSQLLALVSPARVISLSTELLSGVGGAFSVTVLIVLLSVFLLIESNAVMHRPGQRAVGKALSLPLQRRLNAMAYDIQQYVWITLLTGMMYAAAVWLILVLMGVDLPLLWAAVALVLSFVPGIGFILSMIPPVALALLEFGPVRAGILVLLLIVLNSVVDNVIKPRFMQEGFDMGPFVLFAAILFWAYVLGPTGALLAVPLTTAVRRLVLDVNTPRDGDTAELIASPPA